MRKPSLIVDCGSVRFLQETAESRTMATHTNANGEFLRFSIHTLLIVLTIFCVWLGWKVEQARKQREVAALVHEMGGRVRYDYQPNAKPPGPQWLRKQLGRHFFDDVSSCAVARGSGERRIAIVWTDESPKVAPWPHASERGSSGAARTSFAGVRDNL
jgi:hypothetical protein